MHTYIEQIAVNFHVVNRLTQNLRVNWVLVGADDEAWLSHLTVSLTRKREYQCTIHHQVDGTEPKPHHSRASRMVVYIESEYNTPSIAQFRLLLKKKE